MRRTVCEEALNGRTCRLAGRVCFPVLDRLRAMDTDSPNVRLRRVRVDNRGMIMRHCGRVCESYSGGQRQDCSNYDAK